MLPGSSSSNSIVYPPPTQFQQNQHPMSSTNIKVHDSPSFSWRKRSSLVSGRQFSPYNAFRPSHLETEYGLLLEASARYWIKEQKKKAIGSEVVAAQQQRLLLLATKNEATDNFSDGTTIDQDRITMATTATTLLDTVAATGGVTKKLKEAGAHTNHLTLSEDLWLHERLSLQFDSSSLLNLQVSSPDSATSASSNSSSTTTGIARNQFMSISSQFMPGTSSISVADIATIGGGGGTSSSPPLMKNPTTLKLPPKTRNLSMPLYRSLCGEDRFELETDEHRHHLLLHSVFPHDHHDHQQMWIGLHLTPVPSACRAQLRPIASGAWGP